MMYTKPPPNFYRQDNVWVMIQSLTVQISFALFHWEMKTCIGKEPPLIGTGNEIRVSFDLIHREMKRALVKNPT